MKLFELFERDDAPLSPEEVRLRTVLSVMSSRMEKDKLPSMIGWQRLGRVLDKSGVPFSRDQVKAYIEKDFSTKLSMDDNGNIKSVSDIDAGMPDDAMGDQGGLDNFDAMGDLGAEPAAPDATAASEPAPAEEPPAPVVDKNVTDQMAKRALKRRM